jgi:glycosyltransferase involved in cell wall biosynthesis
MKPLCFFNSQHAWGGGEKWHYEVSLRLKTRGYPVMVITNTESELFQRLNVYEIPLQHLKVSNLSFLNPYTMMKLYTLLKQSAIHSIILNLPRDLKAGGIAAKLAGVKHIIYRRGTALAVRNTFLNRFLFRHIVTRIIANSGEIQRTILQNNPDLIAQEKITVIYNGIDLSAYDQRSTTTIYERQNHEVILGNAGRFVEQKGQKYLVELAKDLKAQDLKFRLLIAGKGKLEGELKRYAQELDVAQEIVFVGFMKNIKSFMENIDIFLFPSLHEGSANTLLEAMASCKPIVAFQISSIPEIVAHNETGLLVDVGNREQMLQHVKRLLLDESLRVMLGLNARKRIEERFTMAHMVSEIIKLLEADEPYPKN